MPELSADDISTLNRVLRLIRNFSGPGVIHDGDSIRVVPPAVPRPLPPGDKWTWVKLTSKATGTGLYNAKMQKVVAGNNEDPTVDYLASNYFADAGSGEDCLFRNLIESGNPTQTHLLKADGSVVVLARRAPVDTVGGNPVFEMEVTPQGVFPVNVTKDGGYAGSMNDGQTCNFTYTVDAMDGTELGTFVTPDTPRVPNCKYNTPADDSPGIAYYDGTTLHLYSVAQEIPTCAVVTNITDFQVVDGSYEIQVKTQDSLVWDNKDKTDWITVYTGAACS